MAQISRPARRPEGSGHPDHDEAPAPSQNGEEPATNGDPALEESDRELLLDREARVDAVGGDGRFGSPGPRFDRRSPFWVGLTGGSMGGQQSLALAGLRPEKIRSVLVCVPAGGVEVRALAAGVDGGPAVRAFLQCRRRHREDGAARRAAGHGVTR